MSARFDFLSTFDFGNFSDFPATIDYRLWLATMATMATITRWISRGWERRSAGKIGSVATFDKNWHFWQLAKLTKIGSWRWFVPAPLQRLEIVLKSFLLCLVAVFIVQA